MGLEVLISSVKATPRLRRVLLGQGSALGAAPIVISKLKTLLESGDAAGLAGSACWLLIRRLIEYGH